MTEYRILKSNLDTYKIQKNSLVGWFDCKSHYPLPPGANPYADNTLEGIKRKLETIISADETWEVIK